MTQGKENNLLASLMQMVNENGLEAVAETFRILLNEAMKIERDRTLGAGLYERTDNRKGYANGYKANPVVIKDVAEMKEKLVHAYAR